MPQHLSQEATWTPLPLLQRLCTGEIKDTDFVHNFIKAKKWNNETLFFWDCYHYKTSWWLAHNSRLTWQLVFHQKLQTDENRSLFLPSFVVWKRIFHRFLYKVTCYTSTVFHMVNMYDTIHLYNSTFLKIRISLVCDFGKKCDLLFINKDFKAKEGNYLILHLIFLVVPIHLQYYLIFY